MRLRRDVEDALDEAGAAPRNLLESPPVLHRPPKILDIEGRVERFTKKFGAQTSEARKQAAAAKAQEVDRGDRVALPPRGGAPRPAAPEFTQTV